MPDTTDTIGASLTPTPKIYKAPTPNPHLTKKEQTPTESPVLFPMPTAIAKQIHTKT